MSLLSRLANMFRPGRLTREIDEELRAHLEEAAGHGRDPLEARRALGSSLRHREASRDLKLIPWLDSLRADLLFAGRQLHKRKVTSLAAILSLGLAIGASTAAFRIIDALFLRPLPIAHPERQYALNFHGTEPNGTVDINESCNYPLFRLIAASVGDDANALALSFPLLWDLTYGSDQDLEQASAEYVSGRMFSVFGLRPAAGRLLAADDDSAPGRPYAVLSFDYWSRRFGRDPKAVGRTFRYGRDLYTIVGVAPKGFTGTEPGTVFDIFVPLLMNPGAGNPDFEWFQTLVVLKPGVAPERVRDRIQPAVREFWLGQVALHGDLPQAARDAIVNQKAVLEPARSGVSGMQRDYRQALLFLAFLVALVLLIACANVANLMTAQAAARAHEMALRVSIGAGRLRLVQLVLVETALLGTFAAAIGAVFAWWAAPFVVGRINPDRPPRLVLPADWRILGFTVALTVVVMLLYGLAPALRAARVNPFAALRGGGSRPSRLMHALVAAQTAFCFLVLLVAGLFVATFHRLSNQPLGFSTDRLLALGVEAQQAQPPSVWSHLLETVQAAPGVEKAATAGWPLVSGASWDNFVSLNGVPGSDVASFLSVSPGWLETMKIPLLAGRDFRPAETGLDQVAIVNRAFAERFFKGETVLGKTFEMPQSPNVASKFTIVGLTGDARYARMRDGIPPVAYVPFLTAPPGAMTVMVRTVSRNPLALVPTLRQTIAMATPGLRLNSVRTQQQLIDAQTVRERLLAMLAAFFVAVALLLAAVGLYGVLDYSVFQRRREIGIRLAVGARASHIVRGVSFGIFACVCAGAVAGLALGMASARYLESLLYQVKATDANALALPALALLAAALLASLPPLIRAIRIDPVRVLRSE